MTLPPDFPFHLPRAPLFVILSGPSGVGKDAVVQRMRTLRRPYHFVVTATTRPRRPSERDGVDYLFLDETTFAAMRDRDDLLEHSQVYGFWYGVPKAPIRQALQEGRDIIIKTDVQGVEKLRQVVTDTVAIFLAPPSMEELEHRLRTRKTEPEERLRQRLETARHELEHAARFDYLVVNENGRLDETLAKIEAIIQAEHLRLPPRCVTLR